MIHQIEALELCVFKKLVSGSFEVIRVHARSKTAKTGQISIVKMVL